MALASKISKLLMLLVLLLQCWGWNFSLVYARQLFLF